VSLLVRRSQRAVMLLLGLWVSGQSTLSWALSVSDVVNNTVVDLTMIDGCGDKIRGYQTADKTNNRCWREGVQEPYPDTSSEICAYDNQNDKLELTFDEVQVNAPDIDSYVVVRTPGGGLISETRVDPLPFDVYTNKRRTTNWPLTGQNGTPLNVGRQGKSYRVLMERRDGDTVLYRSGQMDVFVDDCVKRQQVVRGLMDRQDIFRDDGFMLYLSLEDGVATEICKFVLRGLTEHGSASFNSSMDSFSQRCNVQCINNTFANELVDFSTDSSGTTSNVIVETHALAKRNREVINSPGRIGLLANTPLESTKVTFENLLLYIDAEDHLRASGYKNCGGPLNASDTDISIDIIQRQFGERVSGTLAALDRVLFGVISKQVIRSHLEITRSLYESP